MELVLISPQGFDFPPDLVAAKMSSHALLQFAQKYTLIVSSDCLAFASAFEDSLKCQCVVDYTWDEQHTEAKSEPEHIAKVYLTDMWHKEETYEQFGYRVWNEAISQRKAKRAVLCNLAVIQAITGSSGLSICKFEIQPGNAIPKLWATYEEINQLFESDRFPIYKQQNTAKAQALAAAITSAVSKSISEVHSNSADFPGLLTQILREQLTPVISQLEQGYKESVEAALGELQQKSEVCSSRIASLKGIIGELEAGQQETLRALGTFGPEMRAGGAVGPRIAELKKTIAQFEERIGSLYQDLPDRQAGKPPLTLTIDQSGHCIVDNRKRYPLKRLKLLYSADGQANRQLIEFEAPPSGRSKHPFRFPDDPAKVLSFEVCQNERRVSQLVELGSDQDSSLPSAPLKPGIGAWGAGMSGAKLGPGGPSVVNAKSGTNPLAKGQVSTALFPGPNSGSPVIGSAISQKPGQVIASPGPVNSLIGGAKAGPKPGSVIPFTGSGAPARSPDFGFQPGLLGVGGKPKQGLGAGPPIPPSNN